MDDLENAPSILSLTGILSAPITKLNKASSGMHDDRGACLYKRLSKPNELLYQPREIWRRSLLPGKAERLPGNVLQEQRNTVREWVRCTGGARWKKPVFTPVKFLSPFFYLNIPRFTEWANFLKIRKLQQQKEEHLKTWLYGTFVVFLHCW